MQAPQRKLWTNLILDMVDLCMLYVAVELEQKIISLTEKNKRRKSFVFLFIFGQNKTKFRIFSRKYERGQFCPDLTS